LAAVFRQKTGWKLGLMLTGILAGLEILRPAWMQPRGEEARVTFLSVGHGDAAVLEMPGAVFVIDAGPFPRTAERILLPYLRSRGIRRVDALILTHPDLDHYGGAQGLLAEIPVSAVLAPPASESHSATWKCLRKRAQALEVPWREIGAGERLYRRGRLGLWTLAPDSTLDQAEDNDRSLVLLLETPVEKVLFTGDIEAPGQRALAASWPWWRGARLKAPHHGSDRTTLPCFLEAAAPAMVSVSSGRRPGFPGGKTLQLLRAAGARVGVTSFEGALTWELGNAARRNRM
jgi:competence protein ComEC